MAQLLLRLGFEPLTYQQRSLLKELRDTQRFLQEQHLNVCRLFRPFAASSSGLFLILLHFTTVTFCYSVYK